MCQMMKMLVLKPIHFAKFKGNLSFDLLLIVNFLLVKSQLCYHFS